MTPEIRYEPGAHQGWDNYYFTYHGLDWRLLVIRREDQPHSILSTEHDKFNSDWHSFRLQSFPECITPETAMAIITIARDRYERGYKKGVSNKQAQIREALGL